LGEFSIIGLKYRGVEVNCSIKKLSMGSSFSNENLLCVTDENGRVITLDHDDVTRMIFNALKEVGQMDRLLSLNLADKVMYRLRSWNGTQTRLSIYDVQYMIKFVFNECGQTDAATNILSKDKVAVLV
jgi:hypothetical protein